MQRTRAVVKRRHRGGWSRAATLLVLLAGFCSASGAAETGEPTAETEESSRTPVSGEDSPAGRKTWYEQVVVTASRTDRAAREIPFHVTVVSPREPEGAIDLSVSDLVAREVPSLTIKVAGSSLGAEPRDQSLNIRGTGGGSVSHALLLVDGLPMLDPYNASAIWSKTPKELVDRVEVITGGGATVWGNLALSGVVNLITRAPSQRRLEIAARAAEYSTVGLDVSYADTGRRWSGWMAGNVLSTDGYPAIEKRSRGAADEPRYRDYESLSASLNRAFSPSATLQLRALGYHESRGEGTRFDRAENDEWLVAVTADRVASRRETWQVRLFARRLDLDSAAGDLSDDRQTVTLSSHIFDQPVENWGAGVLWSRALGERGNLAAALDYYEVSIERREDLDFDGQRFTQRYAVDGEQQLAGGFVEGRWRPSDRLSLQGAVRIDFLRTGGGRSLRTDRISGAPIEQFALGGHSETTVNPSVGFAFQATAASRWRGAAYTGFRGPMPNEIFVGSAPRNGRVNAPNPNLEPETLVGGELGYDFTPSRRLTARATVFWSETEDIIQRVTVGRVGTGGGVVEPCGLLGPRGSCTQRQNLGLSRAYGVDVDGELRLGSRWSVRLAASRLNASIVENPEDPDLVGNELELTAKLRASLGLSYRHPRGFTATMRVRHIGRRWDETENENLLPAHTIADLGLVFTVADRWELFAGAENLFDEEYRVTLSNEAFLVGEPRLVHFGARFRFAGHR